jgi:dihydroceramidase
MISLPFAKPYPPPPEAGFWNEITSTIDWCEENYVVTPYIAEAVNTISNSLFIILAAFAFRSAIKNKLETRFSLISLGFAIVGIGSWLFHMTLKYEFQLMDELPMVYATCIPVWSVLSEGSSKKRSVSIGAGVLFGANVLTAVYLYFKDPTIHQVAYALLNVLVVGQSVILTKKHVHDEVAKKRLFRCMSLGITIFLSGYFLWNLDVHFCSSWTKIRHHVGIPYGFLFELHAWWHVLTGTGVYYYIVYLEYLRVWILHKEASYRYVVHFGFLPELQLVEDESAKKSL